MDLKDSLFLVQAKWFILGLHNRDAAGWYRLGLAGIQFVSHADVKCAGDHRYVLDCGMRVCRNFEVSRELNAEGEGHCLGQRSLNDGNPVRRKRNAENISAKTFASSRLRSFYLFLIPPCFPTTTAQPFHSPDGSADRSSCRRGRKGLRPPILSHSKGGIWFLFDQHPLFQETRGLRPRQGAGDGRRRSPLRTSRASIRQT
jgi:hypothetical protein